MLIQFFRRPRLNFTYIISGYRCPHRHMRLSGRRGIIMMQAAIRPPGFQHWRAALAISFRLGLGLPLVVPMPADAASVTAKDAVIMVKALGFLEPAPTGGTVAVLFGAGAASKADATEIAGLFGGGLVSSGGTVTAKAVDAAGLGDGTGYIAVIVAEGGSTEAAMTAARAHKILCVTDSLADVRAGHCVMAVHTEPAVVITVNHAVAQDVGVHFAAALAMLIHEI